ncbi:hypothetical protein F8388_024508 [Cannabis sativa]|uniref:Uncharacterized protein n=1 Tax=Cannabis sativa TaxID=3483 RepID=A0A7J6DZT0_CANSA|nr:hypothetical protein F8388_024508 [Cannabis sativa]
MPSLTQTTLVLPVLPKANPTTTTTLLTALSSSTTIVSPQTSPRPNPPLQTRRSTSLLPSSYWPSCVISPSLDYALSVFTAFLQSRFPFVYKLLREFYTRAGALRGEDPFGV